MGLHCGGVGYARGRNATVALHGPVRALSDARQMVGVGRSLWWPISMYRNRWFAPFAEPTMQNILRLSPDDTRADAIRKARSIRQWKRGWFRPLPKVAGGGGGSDVNLPVSNSDLN